MHGTDHTVALRHGLLDGTRVAFAGAESVAAVAALERCRELGAGVDALAVAADPLDEHAVAEASDALAATPGTLVVDAAGRFATAAAAAAATGGEGGGDAARPVGGEGGVGVVRAAGDAAWVAIHAVATRRFIPSGGGKIIILAPPRSAGPHAAPARAAVENLARTLSIEWARFQIRTTAILPGDQTTPAEVASLVAYLASPAGDYFSGCAFTLGAIAAA